jgi:hypothetical protein
MQAYRIKMLCASLPDDADNVLCDNYTRRTLYGSIGIDDPEQERFMQSYRDLRFGWNYARIMAANELPLPCVLDENDKWVWTAYLYHCNPRKYRDERLLKAFRFMSDASKERHTINALLIRPNATIEEVAATVRVEPDVIAAYEALFYNILSRKDDALFLSSVAYPNGRLVEAYNHYVVNEGLDTLLLRAGYNNSVEDVLYWAGFPETTLDRYMGKDIAGRLESMIFANAFVLAKNGWINQLQHSVGLNNAKGFITAAKQAGAAEGESPFYQQGRSFRMMEELKRVKQDKARRRLEQTNGVIPDHFALSN